MILTLVLCTLYITVLTICYGEASVFYSEKQGYNVPDYIREQYKYYSKMGRIKWKGMRLRAGVDPEENKKVYPKADEHRYANCLTIPSNRLRAMGLVARCVIRNSKQTTARMTDGDADLIKETIVNLFRKDSEKTEVFLIGNDEGDKVKVVDDATMLKMEKIVEFLLQEDEDKLNESKKQREISEKVLERHRNKMNEMLQSLNSLLTTVKNINFDVNK